MVAAAISWIVQTLASSALVIVAFVALRSTAVGERFLNYHLERKIAELRNSHEEKTEALRADLAHLQDRGRRASVGWAKARSAVPTKPFWEALMSRYRLKIEDGSFF